MFWIMENILYYCCGYKRKDHESIKTLTKQELKELQIFLLRRLRNKNCC